MDQRPLDTPHSPLTAAERAELETESRVLIAKLKRLLSDRGIAGVSHQEFLTGWDGVQLKPPSFS
jgi:hypothetical protein